MVTITRSANGASVEMARALEDVVREVLAHASGPLNVQFGTWPGDDGRLQFVCRVEAPPATPFGGAIQWRWWSPLLDTPDELREVLEAALRSRAGRSEHLAASAPGSRANAPAAFTEGMMKP